jgi:glutamate carboxypeptidase
VRLGLSIVAALSLCLTAARPCSLSATVQRLSPTEQRIIDYVDAHVGESIEFLERVVNVNSGTTNFEGVRAVGRLFRAELDALGFATRWIPMDSVQRAGHLFAERTGTVGKRVLLIGHLDTVFELDSPFQRFVRSDTLATGPGATDMKGGDVVMLYALKALHAAGALDGARIIVALIGDEEDPGEPLSLGRRDLLASGDRSDVALGFEEGVGGTGTATVARRGFTGWVLRTTGIRAHSSQVFREDLGSGAIYEAARILAAFHDELRGEQYLTFNPGVVLGGTAVEFDPMRSRGTAFGKANVIAQTATVAGDLRTISAEQLHRARDGMRTIVARHLPHTRAEIEFQEGYPAMSPTAENYALLEQLDRVSRDLGFGAVTPVDPGLRGAADVSFVAPVVGASLDGLGLAGEHSHTVQEVVNLNSFHLMTKRAAVLIYRLTRGEGT